MRTKLIITLGGIAVVVIAVVLALPSDDVTTPVAKTEVEASGRAVPDLTLTSFDGESIHLPSLRGTPLVINSWAVWCPFCREELPDLATLQAEFEGRIRVIAIDRAESLRDARSYTDELGITDDLLFLLDPADEFYRAIAAFSMPETIFVAADGSVVDHKRGPMPLTEMRERIQRIL